MKYCTHCGGEIEDDAAICIHCGCATSNYKPANNSAKGKTLGKVALAFMILACIIRPLDIMSNFLKYFASSETLFVGIIGIFISLIPLAWCIPMTIHFNNKFKNDESVGIGFKICTLIFVNFIAGILMLCMPSENKNN